MDIYSTVCNNSYYPHFLQPTIFGNLVKEDYDNHNGNVRSEVNKIESKYISIFNSLIIGFRSGYDCDYKISYHEYYILNANKIGLDDHMISV